MCYSYNVGSKFYPGGDMAKLYRGREWSWWICLNSHNCRFCRENNVHISLGGQLKAIDPTMNQCRKEYWHKLYYIWLKHMKEYHPEILEVKNGK